MLAGQKYDIHKLLLEGVLRSHAARMFVRLAFLEEKVKQLKVSSSQSSAAQEQINAEVAKLRVTLEKSNKLLEAERAKSARQAMMLERLNKQVTTFDNKIKLANTWKNRVIADLEEKNKEARPLTQKLKEAEDFLVAERHSRSTEETTLRNQLTSKDTALATAKDELEASRAALTTYQDVEQSRFEAMNKNYLLSDVFNEKVVDWALRLFDLAIDGTFDQLRE
ncbi:uncharacterized protein LOC122055066 [Zingiber officinale]|uniref:uncharacterized protein LOC122055066 n=1 Tax=Zingiber officinale TaxID=94328 RepID=UPI001C4B8246|nr:uncharacterized protein LOC122055066 [Zingiber officinale]